jgi:hypothetical protein
MAAKVQNQASATADAKKARRTKQQPGLQIAASSEVPLNYMLPVMRDPTADTRRRDAKAADAVFACAVAEHASAAARR